MNKQSKIYIAGHQGMVGSAIARRFAREDYSNIATRPYPELDLTRQEQVEKFFKKEKPEYVIVAAAKVGGILANNIFRAQFIYENLMIEANIIHASYQHGVKKLLFLGSSCIYPKLAPQPLKEEYLLTDQLEFTNEPYAVAKIAGIKLCENYYRQHGCNFLSVMPTNMYGPNDNFDLQTSHALPALIRKIHDAKTARDQLNAAVTIWGTGTPRREFLFVEDFAEAIHFIMQNVNAVDLYEHGLSHLNIGTGKDLTLLELAQLIADIIGFRVTIEYDTSKPDGTPRKLLDVSRLHTLGWHHSTSLRAGIEQTYRWFLEHYSRMDA